MLRPPPPQYPPPPQLQPHLQGALPPQYPEQPQPYVQGVTRHAPAAHDHAPAGQAPPPAVHVFVDHSNLRYCSERPINFHALRYMLLGARSPATLVAVGSHPLYPRLPPTPQWEDAARAEGWETKSYSTFGGREQGVDEDLHARVLKVVCGAEVDSRTVIVLVTGDGNDNGGGSSTSFLECVRLALSKQVMVEMWAWSKSCSRTYLDLQREGRYRGQYKLSFLGPGTVA
jgi:hypothetical protein